MKEQFEFNLQPCPMSILDIENVCQCAIEASNGEAEFYYLIVRTSLGISTIVTCGPVVPDVEFLPTGYSCSLVRMKSEDSKICKFIDSWLNNRFAKLTEAKVVSVEEALNEIRDLKAYMEKYGEGGLY